LVCHFGECGKRKVKKNEGRIIASYSETRTEEKITDPGEEGKIQGGSSREKMPKDTAGITCHLAGTQWNST